MKKLILSITIILFSSNVFALGEVDYKSALITRSYPIALAVQNSFGWGVKFWEATKKIYGYTRVGGVFNTSGVVNLAGAKVEIFPISILGFYAQRDKSRRDVELGVFDCDIVECDGNVDRDRVGAKLGLALGGFFLMGDYQVIKTEMETTKALFADEQHSLLGDPNGDEVHRLQVIAGYKFSEKWKMVGIYISQEMQENQNRDFMKLVGVSRETPEWSLMTTVGVFKNRHQADVFTTLVALVWKGKKGVTLF
jgi:hypothetical protein